MADVTNNWTGGAADGDLNTAGNWSAGAAPGANDRAYWLKENTGGVPPTADMASLTAIDLDLGMVGEGYTQTIGGSGSELDISADLWIYRGTSGKLWLKDGAGTTDYVLVDSTAADPLNHDCVALTGATFTHVNAIRGKVTLLTGVTVTTLNAGAIGASPQSHVVINAGTITVTTANLYSGLVTNSQALATVNIHGGAWTQSLGVLGSTALHVHAGRCNLNVAGTYTNVHVYPGAILDLSQDGSRKIITNFYEHKGATIIGRELLKVTNNMLSP
jgi:hypothetical protein